MITVLTKNKKNIIRGITLVVFIAIISNFIDMSLIKVKADVPSKPSFEVKINSVTPNPTLIGEDITISGTIKPNAFETEVTSQKKEIVLVLDVSGSMKDEVTVNCTNQRVRHWVDEQWDWKYVKISDGYWYWGRWINQEKWDWKYVKVSDGHWTEDYCEEHKQDGAHTYSSTKIAELKKAANNFIDKMKDVPNLKIGIVTYSTNATINKGTYMKGFLDNSDTLHGIVNVLGADGGTNTGEGLRKAEYMLENGESDANKSIVFMSDGKPTFYSVKEMYNGHYDYYTSIDNTNPSYHGTGNSDDYGYCKTYAEKIGAIIKEKKINVFSIGYGLGDENSDENKTMKDIHESMGGIDNDKHFFTTNSGAINGVFSNIADEIIKSYIVDSLAMNMNFNSSDGFSLNISGNTVKLNNIVYNKVENSEVNGKWRYEAEEIPFSFVIKGSKPGVYTNIFGDSNVTFLWGNTTLSGPVDQNNITITIKDNELPNITATLDSATPNPANPSGNVEVKYKINTESFKYNGGNINSGPIDEAVFVVNLTNNMKDASGHRYTNLKNSVNNSILDGTILGDKDIKFNVVGYNKSVKYPTDNDDNTLFGRKSQRENLRLVFENEINVDQTYNDIKLDTNNNNRNIEQALDRANKLLEEKGLPGKNKAMILVTSGDANYDPNSQIIKTISQKGYKIISLDMSNIDGSANVNLKNLHHLLSGQDTDYLIAGSDGGQYNQPEKCYMNDIAQKLIDGITKSALSISNITLNFDLGENFKAIEDGRLGGSGKRRTVTIPRIDYKSTKDANGNKIWVQNPENLEVTFGITVENDKYGSLGFGIKSNNTISYTKLNNTIFTKEIDTPVIEVRSPVIKHGLYAGINEPIDEDIASKKFLNGSKVTLASSFMVYNNVSTATLNVPGGTINSIKVYKNGELINLESDTSVIVKKIDDYNYTFTFNKVSQLGDNVLIVYNETLPTVSGDYNNKMTVEPGRFKIAKIHVVNEQLPELF